MGRQQHSIANHPTPMTRAPENGIFFLLPDRRAPWKEFMASLGTEALVLTAFILAGMLYPEVLPTHEYRLTPLVSTPPPVNHEPAPLRVFKQPELTHLPMPRVDALRVPAELRPKVQNNPVAAPKVNLAAEKPLVLPPSTPVIPRELVKTNVFSTGSSETPTMARAPQQVQTGGFGDPNGLPAQANQNGPATIAQLGAFGLPSGPGYGNGVGGAQGARGVVPSAGFGSSRGTVRDGGFGDAGLSVASQSRSKPVAAAAPRVVPAEIISKPNPVYTDEARQLRIEGEVLLEVSFDSSGTLRVLRVVRGLGHGLDESAVRAAEQIRFKPALRDGQPADSTAVLHIIFQLA